MKKAERRKGKSLITSYCEQLFCPTLFQSYRSCEAYAACADSDPIDCASEIHIAKMHFYYLPLAYLPN